MIPGAVVARADEGVGGHRGRGEVVAVRPSSGGEGGEDGVEDSPLPSGLGASGAAGPSCRRSLQ